MKNFLTIILFLLMNMKMYSQITFQKTYGGAGLDVGNCVRQTSDSGYIICGSTNSFGTGNDDLYLIKTNTTGDTLWTRTYGGTGYVWGRGIQQTHDGGYILSAGTSNTVTGIRLIKTNPSGDTLWTKAFFGGGFNVQQTSDSGYIVSGAGSDMNLVKTNSSGDTIWTRAYGGLNFDHGYCVRQTDDGGYIAIGATQSFGAGSYDVYFVKTDADGNLTWSKTYGGSEDDRGYSCRQTNDGGYILVGTAYSFSFMGFTPDIYVIKTDGSGNITWSKIFGGNICYSHGQDILQTSDGGYAIIGYTQCFGNKTYLIKTDMNGNLLWSKTYGGTATQGSYSIEQTYDGGFIFSGLTDSFGAGSADVYLVKTDSSGNSSCYETIPATLTNAVGTIVSNPPTVVFSNGVYGNPVTTISGGAAVQTLCLSTGIAFINFSQPLINIYPNPLKNKLNISVSNKELSEIILYDVASRKLLQQKFVTSVSLNTEQLAKGLYLYEVRNKDGSYKKGKVVKD